MAKPDLFQAKTVDELKAALDALIESPLPSPPYLQYRWNRWMQSLFCWLFVNDVLSLPTSIVWQYRLMYLPPQLFEGASDE